MTVALNLLRSRFRQLHRARARAVAQPSTDPGSLSGRVGDLDIDIVDLQRAVRALPTRQAQAVVLHYLLGYDVRVVASILGVSEGTIKTALSRARTSLARALKESEVDA